MQCRHLFELWLMCCLVWNSTVVVSEVMCENYCMQSLATIIIIMHPNLRMFLEHTNKIQFTGRWIR